MGEGLSKSPSITKSSTKTCNSVAPCRQHVSAAYPNKGQAGFRIFLVLGPVSRKARKLLWPVGKFQNYWNFDRECKHGEHKRGFRARKFSGTFEKRAPVEHDINIKGFRKGSSMDYFSCIMWRNKNEISEIMGFVRIFWKNNVEEAYLPKMSIWGQIVSEIVAQLCLQNSIQTLLNFFWVDPKKN